MELQGEAKLVRIFIGESDKVHHKALYEVIIETAKKQKLAGATVYKGIEGFGPTSHVRTAKIFDLSSDLPIVIEIVDTEEKINAFLPTIHALFDEATSGGLVTIETVKILKYTHSKKHHSEIK